jgi:hypothetical protein
MSSAGHVDTGPRTPTPAWRNRRRSRVNLQFSLDMDVIDVG